MSDIYTIEFEPNAINDLIDILNYYKEQGGVELAKRMENRILTEVDNLEYMPNRCMTSPYSDELKELNIPKLPYKVFFKVFEADKVISVINVLHTSRNIERLLGR